MKVKIKDMTMGQILVVEMKKGETFYTEPGAIISMEGEADIESKLSGGAITSVFRAVGGGESLFINTITAKTDVRLELGPSVASEILKLDIDGGYILGDGAYLAHEGDIKISSKFGSLNSLFTGSGLFFLHAEGKGTLYLNGCGALLKKEVKDGEVFYLDNTSFVAVEDNVKLEKILVGKGVKSKLFSGEGVMFKITGPATVYYQTNNIISLLLRRSSK